MKLWVALLAAGLAVATPQASDHQDLPEGFSLSDPKWFYDEIQDFLCEVLHFRDRPLGYVTRAMPAGDSVVFENCTPGDRVSAVQAGWWVIRPGDTVFHPLELDLLGPFSSPATCGSRIAYWGLGGRGGGGGDPTISAYVADVDLEAVVCRQALGEGLLGTDNKGHLPYPRWSKDCSQLLMVDDRYITPTRFSLPSVDVEATGSADPNVADTPTPVIPSCTWDPFSVIHVDDDAWPGGDGSYGRPLRTLGQALRQRSLGDTVRLRPGRYDQPLELVDNVMIVGAGSDWTVVAGAAYWGLAVAPFDGVGAVPAHVSLGDFTLEGHLPPTATGFATDDPVTYPDYDAATLSVLLAVVGAVDRPDYPAVTTLVRDYPGLASMRHFGPRSNRELGDTLLHRSAYVPTGDWGKPSKDREHPQYTPTYLHVMRALIDAGADVDADGGSAAYIGHTPLTTFGRLADLRAVELLLAHGADPNRVTSLLVGGVRHVAFNAPNLPDDKQSELRSIVRAMIAAGADHALVDLVRVADTERIAAALDTDPGRIDEWSDLGWRPGSSFGTPLHAAVLAGRLAVAELLLERGADVEALDSAGRTPLARASGNDAMVELLLSHGAAPG